MRKVSLFLVLLLVTLTLAACGATGTATPTPPTIVDPPPPAAVSSHIVLNPSPEQRAIRVAPIEKSTTGRRGNSSKWLQWIFAPTQTTVANELPAHEQDTLFHRNIRVRMRQTP